MKEIINKNKVFKSSLYLKHGELGVGVGRWGGGGGGGGGGRDTQRKFTQLRLRTSTLN